MFNTKIKRNLPWLWKNIDTTVYNRPYSENWQNKVSTFFRNRLHTYSKLKLLADRSMTADTILVFPNPCPVCPLVSLSDHPPLPNWSYLSLQLITHHISSGYLKTVLNISDFFPCQTCFFFNFQICIFSLFKAYLLINQRMSDGNFVYNRKLI